MSAPVDKIKDLLHITDVVSSYIKLEKAGRNLKARCPFHNEKTPSFFVSPERDTFHCFGCQRGGDIFTFVEEIEGIDFKEALRVLGERAGVPIAAEEYGAGNERKRLLDALERATFYFETELSRHPEVLSYLKNRGLEEETIKEFRIGFAPNEWRATLTFLKEKGFTEHELEKVGLVIEKDGRFYDRFRGRIMFPILNASGKIVAFTGRIFEESSGSHGRSGDVKKASDIQIAKYVNSPETVLYNKSRVLYAFDKAKFSLREKNACVLVEGQMDVIMSHQVGIKNAVAASGTALTEDHLELIGRFTENLVLAFDGDAAGFSASGRSIDLALARGFNVSMAKLPAGVDPADLAKKDKTLWEKAVADSKHAVDFFLSVLHEQGLEQRSFRKKVETLVLPYIARIKSKIDQAHFVGVVARATALSEEPIWEALQGITAVETPSRASESTHSGMGEVGAAPRSSWREKMEKRISALFMIGEEKQALGDAHVKAKEEFEEISGKTFEKIRDDIGQDEVEAVRFEVEARNRLPDTIGVELLELLYNLRIYHFREQLRKATNDLQYAEKIGDEKLIAEKLKECAEISKKTNISRTI